MDRVLQRSALLSFPLADTAVQRYEKERREEGFMTRRIGADANSCAVVCKEDGSGVLLNGGPSSWLHQIVRENNTESFLTVPLTQAVYVGEDTANPRNVFVVGAGEVKSNYVSQRTWISPLALFAALSAAEQSLLSLALSMWQWTSSNTFCGRCGSAMQGSDCGLTRSCTSCKNRIHPSVIPAMIVAVLDGRGNVILSHRLRPYRDASGMVMRTVLSGFVAQGESMEETVVREVQEETGARVTRLRYVGSQPWPTPYELMTCYYAVAEDSPNLVAEVKELLRVDWVSKEDVRRALAGEHPDFGIPPSFTAAHVLLSKWVNGEVDDWGEPTGTS